MKQAEMKEVPDTLVWLEMFREEQYGNWLYKIPKAVVWALRNIPSSLDWKKMVKAEGGD